MAENNTLDYVNFDFNDLVQQLTDRVRLRDAWKDTYRSGTGQMLIELFAYIANMVLFYVERRAEESYLSTARNKSSVINLVRLLNYQPKRKTSATGILKFTLSSTAVKKVFITKYTIVESVGGRKYLVNEDAVINIGQTQVEVNAIQGELAQIQQISGGGADQFYKIEDTNIENSNFEVFVDGEEWTSVTSFINSQNDSKEYRTIAELDGSVRVIFGNGIFGKAPAEGSTILFRYIKSAGASGNVFELNRLTTLKSNLFDEDGTLVSNITVTNSSTFLGGDEEEDIDEIKFEAPRVFATGDRAVTKDDFIAILENFPGVANANVWGENEEDPPNVDMFNRVKLVVLLQDWQNPSDAFKQDVTDLLFSKSMITVRYSFVEAIQVRVIPILTIKAIRGTSLTQVQADVEAAIEAQFILGDTTKIGQAKRFSDLMAIIEAVVGVDYLHMTIEVRKDLVQGFDSFNEFGEILYAQPVKRESVKVFLDDDQVAIDDGLGGFTSLISGITVTGSIDYATGEIGVSIDPDASSGSSVYVRYQQDLNGDLEVEKQEILRLYDIEVPSISYSS